MSSSTLFADGYDIEKRNIILNKNSKSLITTKVDDSSSPKIAKTSSSSSSSPTDSPPPRAYLRIVGVCCIWLEPIDATPVIRQHLRPRSSNNDDNEQTTVSIRDIFRFLITDYQQLKDQNESLEFFADVGSEPAVFSKLAQAKIADLFLRSSSDYEKRNDIKEFKIIIMDPHGDRWQFQELEQDKKANAEREALGGMPPKIVVEAVPAEVFSPSLRYSRPIFPSFDAKGVAARIKQSKNIIVAVGAGMSVAAGITDFRSANGLYAQLKRGKYDLPQPESLFTLDYFKKNPETFYKISEEMQLWPGRLAPTHSHHFIHLLEKHGKLRQVFTQNIDCLERAAGVDPNLLVEAHGSFATAHCTGSARHPMPTDELRDLVYNQGKPPLCPTCSAPVKPGVTFFQEALPKLFFERLDEQLGDCDLLLVIGTSLAVYPFAFVAGTPKTRKGTKNGEPLYPRVLLNMERVGEFCVAGDLEADNEHPENIFDVFLGGDCQVAVKEIAAHLGWSDELETAFKEGKKNIEGK